MKRVNGRFNSLRAGQNSGRELECAVPLPNDQRRRFCRAMFLAPHKNSGKFHLYNSFIVVFVPAKYY